MQALARLAATELSRSVSTALVLWAGKTTCPSLTCGEVPRCPDCICAEGRRLTVPPGQQCSWTFAFVYIFLGFVVGVLGAEFVVYCWSTTVTLSPLAEQHQATLTDRDSQESIDSEDFLVNAKAQAKKYGSLARSIGSIQ